MSFEVDHKPAFEIPLKDVSQATTGISCSVVMPESRLCVLLKIFKVDNKDTRTWQPRCHEG